ncbi:MAG: hypothetical protein IT559_03395 [Alphaproteobacteria bacterium]|nr:hypothetical protein [Alphaproteobacteria bacterium]
MTTKLPLDDNNNPIPALRLKNGGAHTIVSAASSTRNSASFAEQTRIVSVYATEDIYLKFGSAGVTASSTDHFFPAGLYYDFAIGGEGTGHATHLAVLRRNTDGIVYVSEKE